MKLRSLAMMALLAGANFGYAADAQQLSPVQTKEIEQVVRNYLIQNPEILVEVSQALQAKQQQQMQAEASSFIKQNAQALVNEKVTIAGSSNPSVTIVEFFDYSCGHCKQMSPIVKEALKTNPNLKVVYREFPIFGNTSVLAAQAAIAAGMQGKYLPMQEALFGLKKIDETALVALAKQQGLDIAKFQADMKSKVVANAIAQNRQFAESMKLFGTPVFIVLSTPNGQYSANTQPYVIPGSTSLDNLNKLVKMVAEAKQG